MQIIASLPTHPSPDHQAAEIRRSPLAEGAVVVVEVEVEVEVAAAEVAPTDPSASPPALFAVSVVVVSATDLLFVHPLSFFSQSTDFGTK